MFYSVGVVELKTISKGVEACDDALKSAGVKLVSAHPACPGKYEMILTGELTDVQTAVDRVKAKYGMSVIDAVMLGKIEESVVKALLGGMPPEPNGALGIVETFSAASAILAADAAVKAASVEIIELRVSRGMGGKGFVMITGNVADVTAAVEAGSLYAKGEGLFASSTVIPAPHEELWQYI